MSGSHFLGVVVPSNLQKICSYHTQCWIFFLKSSKYLCYWKEDHRARVIVHNQVVSCKNQYKTFKNQEFCWTPAQTFVWSRWTKAQMKESMGGGVVVVWSVEGWFRSGAGKPEFNLMTAIITVWYSSRNNMWQMNQGFLYILFFPF